MWCWMLRCVASHVNPRCYSLSRCISYFAQSCVELNVFYGPWGWKECPRFCRLLVCIRYHRRKSFYRLQGLSSGMPTYIFQTKSPNYAHEETKRRLNSRNVSWHSVSNTLYSFFVSTNIKIKIGNIITFSLLLYMYV